MASARSHLPRAARFAVALALAAAPFLAAAPALAAGPASRATALVPMPRELALHGGTTALGPGWVVRAGVDDEAAARLIAAEAESCYRWRWPVVAGGGGPAIEIRAAAPPEHAPPRFATQGYTLEIAGGRVVIAGATADGRFHGAQTLRQLMRSNADGALPRLAIRDWPALEWRGISDDISRGQVSTLDDFRDIIRQLAYYKMNLYQLYMEDVFAFPSGAAGDPARGALTADQLSALVEEGRRNHVTVSPIFETLAHQERLLDRDETRRYAAGDAEEYGAGPWAALLRAARDLVRRIAPRRSGEDATAAAFSARDPGTLAYVTGRVDEIATVTRGPFFHVGGDEWQPPAARRGAAAEAEAVRAYGRYIGSLARHLRERFGCRAMVYGDVILGNPDAAIELPRDVIVVDWHYDPQDSFPSLGRLEALGFRDVFASPALWTWHTFYPNYARAFRNVGAFADAAKRSGAMGCIAAAWGDDGAENLRENNGTGYAFAAAASWERDVPATDEFLRRFVAAHCGGGSAALARAERRIGWQEFDGVGWAGRLYHRALPVRPRSPATVARMTALAADMRDVMRDLDAAESAVRFRRDHLAALRHCARRYLYIAERELALDRLGRALEGRTARALAPAARERTARELEALAEQADRLRDEFGTLWLARNRPAGLEFHQQRMAEQGTMLRRLARLARDGRLRVDTTYSSMQALSAR